MMDGGLYGRIFVIEGGFNLCNRGWPLEDNICDIRWVLDNNIFDKVGST